MLKATSLPIGDKTLEICTVYDNLPLFFFQRAHSSFGAVADGQVLVCGGVQKGLGISEDCFELNRSNKRWEVNADLELPDPRAGAAYVVTDNTLWVAGELSIGF